MLITLLNLDSDKYVTGSFQWEDKHWKMKKEKQRENMQMNGYDYGYID